MNEIEKEEKEKLWYYSQLQGLSKRLDELPHVETVSVWGAVGLLYPGRGVAGRLPGLGGLSPRPTCSSQQFSMQMDLIRQQLEFEAQHIRSLMEERFGTSDEMVQRAQVRQWPGPCSDVGFGALSWLREEPQLMSVVICPWANQ